MFYRLFYRSIHEPTCQPTRRWLILPGLTVLGVVTHMLPHNMGVSTVGALGMLCAAYLPRKLLAIPVLVTIAVVDLYYGAYHIAAMSFVYLGHLVATFSVAPGLKSINVRAVVLAALINAFVFYVLSNITPMAMQFYPNTPGGWLACYANGLPFLLRGLFANLVFGGLAFGCINLVSRRYAYRIAAT